MALIKCSECSAEISDKASYCPKCGAPVAAHSQESIGNFDVHYNNNDNSGMTPAFVAKNKRNLGVLITFLVICAVGIVIAVSTFGNGGSAESKNSHSNCMFIGYADPNRPLNGKSHCTSEPQYGYRPVYVDRNDIYNTYHFH